MVAGSPGPLILFITLFYLIQYFYPIFYDSLRLQYLGLAFDEGQHGSGEMHHTYVP